jgi:hypothetical protein
MVTSFLATAGDHDVVRLVGLTKVIGVRPQGRVVMYGELGHLHARQRTTPIGDDFV